jgi:RNA polymerase sigma-70 factor (ECF subfamily)
MSEEQLKIEAIFMKSYEEHADAILRYCVFQTSNREVALDILQDTFTKTWMYLKDGKEIDNIKAFLYKVAKNLIIDYRRKKKTYSLDAITETGVDFASADEEADATDNFDKAFVVGKLEKLDPDDREILTMRYVNEMSIKEIAETLDLTANNVSVKIHRAVEKMKKVLDDYEL